MIREKTSALKNNMLVRFSRILKEQKTKQTTGGEKVNEKQQESGS